MNNIQLPPRNKALDDPRFIELDRLIAIEDEREAARLANAAPGDKRKSLYDTQSKKWAEMRARRPTCTHETWIIRGELQWMCPNCGTTRKREGR